MKKGFESMSELKIILEILESMRNEKNIEGMKRFGIESTKILGISMKDLENMKKQIGKNHDLALQLWSSGIQEARMLGAMIAEPQKATPDLMTKWAEDFDNWAICDSVCGKFFRRSPFIFDVIDLWSSSDKLYIKRAAFSCIAWISVHSKHLNDSNFDKYFELITKNCTDDRKHIAKAVNWSLRQIGKRNSKLCVKAIELAEHIIKQNPQNKTALWIAKDAIRELNKRKY